MNIAGFAVEESVSFSLMDCEVTSVYKNFSWKWKIFLPPLCITSEKDGINNAIVINVCGIR